MMFPAQRFRLQVVAECGSTNEVLLGLRASPDFAGRALLALNQTAGRGRRGRDWESQTGNLALSMAFRLPADGPSPALLPFLAGLALFDQVAKGLPPGADLRLKWPNDLYLNGLKLAGMLAQARQSEAGLDVVLGIGVNLRHAPAGMPAISIPQAGGEAPDPESFALGLLLRLEKILAGAADFPWLRERWEPKARLQDGPLWVVGEPAPVKAVALEPSGELLVESEDGKLRRLSSEEVSLRFAPAEATPGAV